MRSLLATAALGAVLPFVGAVHLKPEALEQVFDVMTRINNFSWENGTEAQAVLEWKYPHLSVFSNTAPLPLPDDLTADSIPEIVTLAQDTLNNRPVNFSNPAVPRHSPSPTASPAEGDDALQRRQEGTPTSAPVASGAATSAPVANTLNVPLAAAPALPSGQPLLEDGAAGDPPSLGIAVLIADKATGGGRLVKNVGFTSAAQSQVDYLLYGVPRNADGAISHRAASVQLWADNVYMVPPFLAYYGVMTNNQTLVQIAFDQVRLYRAALQNPDTKLWRHMTDGPEAGDPDYWATGNAWAAAGCLRVLATIKHSQFAGAMGDQMAQLQSWAAEILTASKQYMTHDGLLYIDNSTTFVDAAATALMASAGFRMSTLSLTNDHVDMAADMLAGASRNVNATGYLTNVTDPLAFRTAGTYSPEGQSFVLLAYAAYNDWDEMGKPGNTQGDDPLTDGARRAAASVGVVLGAVAVALALVV